MGWPFVVLVRSAQCPGVETELARAGWRTDPRMRSSACSTSSRHDRAVLSSSRRPRVARVLADRLEAHREQQVGGHEAARQTLPRQEELVSLRGVPEGLDGSHPAARQVFRSRLDEHARETSAGVLRQDPGGHQQDRVRADGAGGEGQRPGDELRRGVEHEAGRLVVDVGDTPAGAPLQQGRRDPRLLLEGGVPRLRGAGGSDGLELPEDAPTAGVGEVREAVERECSEPATHQRCASAEDGSPEGARRRRAPAAGPDRLPPPDRRCRRRGCGALCAGAGARRRNRRLLRGRCPRRPAGPAACDTPRNGGKTARYAQPL